MAMLTFFLTTTMLLAVNAFPTTVHLQSDSANNEYSADSRLLLLEPLYKQEDIIENIIPIHNLPAIEHDGKIFLPIPVKVKETIIKKEDTTQEKHNIQKRQVFEDRQDLDTANARYRPIFSYRYTSGQRRRVSSLYKQPSLSGYQNPYDNGDYFPTVA